MARRARSVGARSATKDAHGHTSAVSVLVGRAPFVPSGGVIAEVHLPGRVSGSRSRQRLGAHADVREDLLRDGVVDGRDDAHPGVAGRAAKRVETEGAHPSLAARRMPTRSSRDSSSTSQRLGVAPPWRPHAPPPCLEVVEAAGSRFVLSWSLACTAPRCPREVVPRSDGGIVVAPPRRRNAMACGARSTARAGCLGSRGVRLDRDGARERGDGREAPRGL